MSTPPNDPTTALPPSPLLNPEQALGRVRIVLSHPSHPGNIGAAARAMKTMGIADLALVRPKRFPDAEASARAAGADDILAAARVCDTLDEALAGAVFAVAVTARRRNLGPAPLAAREAAPLFLAAAADGPVAFVFGNETAGLANDEVQRCQRCLHIPSQPDFQSLNLGAAVQLVCYELRLAAYSGEPPTDSPVVPFASKPATIEENEGFFAHLERVMIDTGFHDPRQPKRLLPKLRRLFGRAGLERDEINILRGILDAVERKIKR